MQSEEKILLPNVLNLALLATLSDEFQTAMGTKPDIEVDASGVMRVSTVALQFLLAIANRCLLLGGSMKLIAPSQSLFNAVTLLGLQVDYSRSFKDWPK